MLNPKLSLCDENEKKQMIVLMYFPYKTTKNMFKT
jgi:hypothetical protein